MNRIRQILSSRAARVIGIALMAIFAIFTCFAVVSFLFTWRADSSLADNYLAFDGVEAVNQAGPAGSGWGHLLVSTLFGLGALVLCYVLFRAAYALLRSRKVDWIRFCFGALLGSLVASLFFALTGHFASSWGWNTVWEGGIGGGCGSFLVASMLRLFGVWVTSAIVLAFSAAAAYLAVPEERWEALRLRRSSGAGQDSRADALQTSCQMEEGPEETGMEPQDAPEGEPVEEEPDSPDYASSMPAADTMPAAAMTPQFPAQEPAPEPDSAVCQPDPAAGTETSVSISGPEEELSTEVDEELPQLDIRSDVDRYKFPSLDLLEDYVDKRYTTPEHEILSNTEKIKMTLASFKIPIESITASVGYTVTLYKITLGEGVRVNTVKNLEDDIAIKIGIKGVRVVMLADAVGIEVPNAKPSVVPLKAILNSDAFRNSKGELPIAVGYTITTKAKVFDLADAPHLLVAGATKQGKSVGLNAIITSLLYVKHPTELKFVFVDPKMVEFSKYSKLIKHYLALLPPLDGTEEADAAIVKDSKNADSVLRSLCVEMDQRYKLLAAAGVNKVTDYNEKYSKRFLRPDEGHHFIPYLVIIVDEYADLTKANFGSDRNLSRSIENSINRLAAKGRAAGLHIVIATQRPSVDVITGTIKGNFPTRMAFRTVQRQDSQTILGIPGAEKLIGRGDMLFFAGADAERVQCALVDSGEIDALTDFISSQQGYKQCCPQPYYLPDPGDDEGGSSASGEGGGLIDMKNLDPMFEEAARLAVDNQGLSTSMLQRKMQVGFARAGRIMDQLEAAGVVGPQQGAKPREALVADYADLQRIFDAYVK